MLATFSIGHLDNPLQQIILVAVVGQRYEHPCSLCVQIQRDVLSEQFITFYTLLYAYFIISQPFTSLQEGFASGAYSNAHTCAVSAASCSGWAF